MSDKQHNWFALPGHAVVALQGPDAQAFAHAQFMNDLRPLDDGQWQWSGWLSPKGRVLALFVLLRRSPESIWLVLPDADAQAFSDALKRFVFRSKVAISVRDDLHVAGCFDGCGSGG
ncbi:MAG: folate-binding protein, partial [Pseudomonadota bacterium]|nr:folate-binding protein [Pseudomonadota bacterium]